MHKIKSKNLFLFNQWFLVACYVTLHPAFSGHWSICWSVGPSVRRSVALSYFTFLRFLPSLGSLSLPKWLNDLKYGPCPPARDLGSHVSGLVFFNLMPFLNTETRKVAFGNFFEKFSNGHGWFSIVQAFGLAKVCKTNYYFFCHSYGAWLEVI